MAGFNYNHLYYFYMTAKMGGVTEAARKLNTSQSSLSSQLKILEGALDIQLFLKAGRRLELTDRGEAVLAHCEKIFGAADALGAFIQTITGDNSALIRIGISKDICGSFIGKTLGRVFLSSPGKSSTRVRMEAGMESDLRKKLHLREIDIVLTSESIPADGIHFVRRLNLPVALFAAHSVCDRLSSSSNAICDLLSECELGLALPLAGTAFRQECESFMVDQGIKKRITYESNYIDSLLTAVEDGLAVAFMPTAFAQLWVARGKVRAVGPKASCFSHQIFIYSQSEKDGQSLISAIESVV